MGGSHRSRGDPGRTAHLRSRRRAAREPDHDLLSPLANAGEGGDHLSDDELVMTIMFLVIAGCETTANTRTSGIYDLLRNPAHCARLKADPAFLDTAVDEILRSDGSTRIGPPRFALEDVDIDDQRIHGRPDLPLPTRCRSGPQGVRFPTDLRRWAHAQPAHRVLSRRALLPRSRLGPDADEAIARGNRRAVPDIALVSPQMTWKSHFVIRGFDALPVRWHG